MSLMGQKRGEGSKIFVRILKADKVLCCNDFDQIPCMFTQKQVLLSSMQVTEYKLSLTKSDNAEANSYKVFSGFKIAYL